MIDVSYDGAGGGNRTRTPLAGPRILSPVRLPVPPPRPSHHDTPHFLNHLCLRRWRHETAFLKVFSFPFVQTGRYYRSICPSIYRCGWSRVPLWAVVVGNALVAVGFFGIFLVYRENTFTSATIEVAANQAVISTGPYAMVRHPMYANGLLYFVGTPLALGSYWGLAPFAAMLPFLIWRLLDEERFLATHLPGYSDYQKKVRHRLLPRIW